MDIKLKLWLFTYRNTISMMRFTFISVLMLLSIWIVDVQNPVFLQYIPENVLLSVEISTSLLQTLAGTFLTVATFTFSTILTMLLMYGSTFTPRVIQKFINKPHVLSVIGIFVGGFFYSVLSLFILQRISPEQKVLAGTLGIIYAVVSMIYFLLFVQQVIRDSKGENLIQDIYESAKILVVEEAEKRKNAARYTQESIVRTIKISSLQTGHLYEVNHKRLIEIIGDIYCELIITKKIGEYLPKGVYLAELQILNLEQLDEDYLKQLSEDIAHCFVINSIKNDSNDYHQEITNLVEISLRVLSPGINDPNTAINCIDKISNLLGILFSSKNRFIIMNQHKQAKIVYISYSVEDELYLAFYQIFCYGKEDPSVAQAVLEGLYMIYMISDESAKREVKKFFAYAYELLVENMVSSWDKQRLSSIYDDFLLNKDEQANQELVREELS